MAQSGRVGVIMMIGTGLVRIACVESEAFVDVGIAVPGEVAIVALHVTAAGAAVRKGVA